MTDAGTRPGYEWPLASHSVSRRAFLTGLAAAVLAACTGDDSSSGGEAAASTARTSAAATTAATTTTSPGPTAPLPELTGDPFTLGVASGDPLPDAVMLWTRLAPDPLSAASMPQVEVPVAWELATDAELDEVIAAGTATAEPRYAHSVHVDATGLAPDTIYWYRFRVGDYVSPVGRTRTAPRPGSSPERLNFVVANCQAWQSGYYTPYRHLAGEDVDVVLFVGDYIYEAESSTDVRPHDLPLPFTLDDYRSYYGLNKTDPDLQAAHAAFPWIVTWDDHEVEDNYAADKPGTIGSGQTAEEFAARRRAAYQAFWEHIPIRVDPPEGGRLVVHRSFDWGDLARLPVVDNRQYRTQQPSGEGSLPRLLGGGPQQPGAFDPEGTILGDEQEAWLLDLLRSSVADWNLLVQQSVMAEADRAPDDPEHGFSMDSWDGYVVERNRLLAFVRDEEIHNFVSLGGDIHSSAVTDLLTDYHAPDPDLVGSELIAPSISALELLPEGYPEATRTNPHIHLFDTERRGYLRCELTRDHLVADYRWVATTAQPESEIETASTWEIRSGTPGARQI